MKKQKTSKIDFKEETDLISLNKDTIQLIYLLQKVCREKSKQTFSIDTLVHCALIHELENWED